VKTPVAREWVRVSTGDWKLVELPPDSQYDIPLRTVAWVWELHGSWHAAVSGKTDQKQEEVDFDDQEDAKRWAEAVWRLEDM